MDTVPDASPPPVHDVDLDAVLDTVVAGMRPGWTVLRSCGLSGDARHPAVRIRYALLHPEVGVALLDIAPDQAPDAVAHLHRRLGAVAFGAIFPGHLPIVHCCLPAHQLRRLGGVLDRAFAAERPITLPGGAAWIDAVRRALSVEVLQPAMAGGAPRHSGTRIATRHVPGLRALLGFWGFLLLAFGGGVAVLQYLGAPERPTASDPAPRAMHPVSADAVPLPSFRLSIIGPEPGRPQAGAAPAGSAVLPAASIDRTDPILHTAPLAAPSSIAAAVPGAPPIEEASEGPTAPNLLPASAAPADAPAALPPAPAQSATDDGLRHALVERDRLTAGLRQRVEALERDLTAGADPHAAAGPDVASGADAAMAPHSVPGPAGGGPLHAEGAGGGSMAPTAAQAAHAPPAIPDGVAPALATAGVAEPAHAPAAPAAEVRAPALATAPPAMVGGHRAGHVNSAAGPAAGMGRPIERVLDRRCRDILARAQLGEEPSDVDRAYLRRGCKARN